jgi:pimeloyl-ACP methyl ester carboxylesterase
MRLADPVGLYRTELALGRGTIPMMDQLLLKLAVPCALVEGERTRELADAPSKCVSGIRVLIVPDAGHTMMLDNPVGFARVIAEALDELATRPLHMDSRDL